MTIKEQTDIGDHPVRRITGSEPRTATFAFVRETTGAYLFKEVDRQGNTLSQNDALIGSLYTRKKCFPAGAPRRIRMTVEPVTD